MEDIQVRREEWQRLQEAVKRGDNAEIDRAIIKHVAGIDWAETEETIAKRQRFTLDRLLAEAKQWPNIPLCVKATMDDLREMGLWEQETNPTYDLATSALADWRRLERKRLEYLSAKRSYEESWFPYATNIINLAKNLVYLGADPLSGSSGDPIQWFVPGSKVVKIFQEEAFQKAAPEAKITLPTLRKYQRLGLIPKPIRLGRYAHYSVLTIYRIIAIIHCKEQGIKLSDMKPHIDRTIQAMVEFIGEEFPDDRLNIENAISTMMWIASGQGQSMAIMWKDLQLAGPQKWADAAKEWLNKPWAKQSPDAGNEGGD